MWKDGMFQIPNNICQDNPEPGFVKHNGKVHYFPCSSCGTEYPENQVACPHCGDMNDDARYNEDN
jgi:formate dehydrogenase maturation protein FdhE